MKNRQSILIAMLLVAGAAAMLGQSGGSDIESTKHNLTATGPGNVKVGTGELCLYCHTPHAASPVAPLWNRNDPGTYYETYDSSTLISSVGQPTGSSRLCLSCHDGTIALAQTYNPLNTPIGNTVYISNRDRGYLGTDLSDDHPISQVYDSSVAVRKGELRDPSALPRQLPLDHEGRLQCTTCHDPHDDSLGKFLRMDNRESSLCVSCHAVRDWESSAHATSSAALSGSSDNWDNLQHRSSVRDAGCESCHRPHTAGGRQRLLRHEAEENNCLNCHDGSVASTDIAAAVRQISTHPVDRTTAVHDPTENPANMREHVECADCHHPHRTSGVGNASAPFIKPTMAGASGVSPSGSFVAEATYEYEVCYKCHSSRNMATPVVDRVLGTNNIADEFSPSAASFHPVQTSGVASVVPSLMQGYNTSSIIHCTSCHGSDDADARGPHGSRFKPLLRANYSVLDSTGESPSAYELCYTCHNRASILADESFKLHRRHIVEERTPCSACHDPHGVRENTHLVNFDRSIVQPVATGEGPSFQDQGDRRGSCTLQCHGKLHVDEQYP